MKEHFKDVFAALLLGLLALSMLFAASTVWHLGAFGAVKIHEIGGRIK